MSCYISVSKSIKPFFILLIVVIGVKEFVKDALLLLLLAKKFPSKVSQSRILLLFPFDKMSTFFPHFSSVFDRSTSKAVFPFVQDIIINRLESSIPHSYQANKLKPLVVYASTLLYIQNT